MTGNLLLMDEPNADVWIDKVEPSWQGDIPVTLIFNNATKKRKFIAKELSYDELDEIITVIIIIKP